MTKNNEHIPADIYTIADEATICSSIGIYGHGKHVAGIETELFEKDIVLLAITSPEKKKVILISTLEEFGKTMESFFVDKDKHLSVTVLGNIKLMLEHEAKES